MELTIGSSGDGSSNSQPPQSSAPGDNDNGNPASKKPVVRKRTKTGCLTCRRRRIKCDEAKDTCNNCIKSKRQCEGYSQRVIFKNPLGFSGPFGPMSYPTPSPQVLMREQLTAAQKSSSQALQIIAPKPPTLGYHHPSGALFYPGQVGQATPPLNLNDPNAFTSQPGPSKYTFFPPTTVDAFSQQQWRQGPPPDFVQFPPGPSEQFAQGIPPGPPQPSQQQQQQQPRISQSDKGKARAEPENELLQVAEPELEEWEYLASDDESMDEFDDTVAINDELELHEAGVVAFHKLNQTFGLVGTETRTFSAFSPLATYEPSASNSPLNDRQIAAVFWHFVNVTGPSISLYERHPLDPAPMFVGQPIPKARQHIWTYTFPILSFTHPGLLHAILAMASLQIAKLQAVPPTASLKHYHLAIRRIANNCQRLNKRSEPSNLAATLVLAFYEVWSSDHDKWSRHLLGARLIIREIPFVEMTRSAMAIKMRKRLQQEMEQTTMGDFGMFASYEESGPLHKDWDLVDVPLLGAITGRDISYDDLGMLPEPQSAYRRPKANYTSKDMERYEQVSDLFWWYCKMDVYQSILGGTRLFMEYDAWTQCPPRAPMGRLDAIYGTYDHLILLLGRLADFASKDLTRKRAVFKNNPGRGGSPGMFPGMVPRHPEKFVYPRGFTPPRDTPSMGSSSSPPGGPSSSDNIDLDAKTAEAYREWEDIKQAFLTLRAHFGPEFEPLGMDVYPTRPTPFGLAAHYRTYSIAGIWMNYYMGLIVLHRAHPEMPPIAMVAAGMSAMDTAGYCMEIGRIAAGLEENTGKLTSVSTLMAAALIECCFPLFVAGIQYRDDPQRQWLIQRLHDIARLTGWQSARQIAVGCESAWTKAAQLGRGPPYTRTRDVDPPSSIWYNARRLDRRILEVEGDESKIVLAKAEKAYYAMGLLAVEHDLEKLDLEASERK